MAVLVIPIAVSVHTVVSFVFSMTLQPMWHSTIFGPYFVVGAIFSGIAALIVAMIVFRRAYGLQGYLKPIHFRYLGQLLLVMSLLWFYFTFAEYLTGYYGSEPEEMKVFWAKFSGPFWPLFWGMALTNFVIPVSDPGQTRAPHRSARFSSPRSRCSVGMWLERFIIVVPTLSNPRLPFAEGHLLADLGGMGGDGGELRAVRPLLPPLHQALPRSSLSGRSERGGRSGSGRWRSGC